MAELPFIASLRSLGHAGLADALQGLLDDYPLPNRPQMDARLALGGAKADMAALLEVAAHRLLVRAGFKVDALEPDLTALGLKGRPDFLASHPTCGQAIVEVRWASTADDQVRSEHRIVGEVMEGLNKHLQPAKWRMSVGVIARQGAGIPFPKLAALIRAQMQIFETQGQVPLPFRIDDPTVSFQVTPQPGGPGRVAIWSGGWAHETFQVLTIVERLRKVLGRKGSKYGTPKQPMVLVVGLDGYMGTGQEEILSALLGRETLYFDRQSDGSAARGWGRDDSGFFGTDAKPQFTRLSGILFLGEWNMTGLAGQFLSPRWTSQRPWAWYVNNPHALWPATEVFSDLPACKLTLVPGQGITLESRVGRDLVDALFF